MGKHLHDRRPLGKRKRSGPLFTSHFTGARPVFDNQGSLTQTNDATAIINAILSNSGTVAVEGGTVQLWGGGTQTPGATTLNGGALTSNKPLIIQGGILDGFGAISADVASAGQVSPGIPVGILTIDGKNTQEESGTFGVDIQELTPGTEFNQLRVSKISDLQGTLRVNLGGGFLPQLGDTFEVMNFDTRAGGFTEKTGSTV